jgi:hypothetical protein
MPKIAIEQTADGYIAKVAEFDASIQVDVDAEIARRAADICKGKQVRWGKFSSLAKLGKIPGSEPAPVTGYVHEFSCVPIEQATYEPAPADWKPSASDETDARTFFQTYYARRDSGEFGAALNMFASSMRSEPAKWSDEMRGFNASLGAGKRRVTGVTWYVNPEQSEHPGIYAAVDFVGDYAKAYFYCGYLALYRRGPGDYEIVREEQNRFMRADSQTEPEQLAQMRATMCRGQ